MIVHNWHGTRFRRSKHSHRENVKLSSVGWTKPSGYATQVDIFLRDDDTDESLSVQMDLADAIDLRDTPDRAIKSTDPTDLAAAMTEYHGRQQPSGRPF